MNFLITVIVFFSAHGESANVPPKVSELSSERFLFPPICGCEGCKMTSPFGMRTHPTLGKAKMHTGCDLGAPLDSAVYASADGEVLEVFKSYKTGKGEGYGNQVTIRHKSPSGETFLSHYGHLNTVEPGIEPRAKVKKSQKIATVDSTGMSTGHHLHFEILRCKGDGGEKDDSCQKVNPEDFINLKNMDASCEDIRDKNQVPEVTIGQ